jgi:lysylphosphatidylglycerol synthetase-like protein (DUF2156 family)
MPTEPQYNAPAKTKLAKPTSPSFGLTGVICTSLTIIAATFLLAFIYSHKQLKHTGNTPQLSIRPRFWLARFGCFVWWLLVHTAKLPKYKQLLA